MVHLVAARELGVAGERIDGPAHGFGAPAARRRTSRARSAPPRARGPPPRSRWARWRGRSPCGSSWYDVDRRDAEPLGSRGSRSGWRAAGRAMARLSAPRGPRPNAVLPHRAAADNLAAMLRRLLPGALALALIAAALTAADRAASAAPGPGTRSARRPPPWPRPTRHLRARVRPPPSPPEAADPARADRSGGAASTPASPSRCAGSTPTSTARAGARPARSGSIHARRSDSSTTSRSARWTCSPRCS